MQLLSTALLELCVWLMDLWRVLAEWRSASMECGGQCVMLGGITMMLELCADNWVSVSTGRVGHVLHWDKDQQHC